jgi:hypothetical protein
MKKFLFMTLLFAFSIGQSSFASGLSIQYPPKSKRGYLPYVEFREATAYCKNLGMRLPTAREYAKYAQSLGAKGVRETAFASASINDPRVKEEIAKNSNEKFFAVFKSPVFETYTDYPQTPDSRILIDFYYSSDGYTKPSGARLDDRYWTSSADPDQTNYQGSVSAAGGGIGNSTRSYPVPYHFEPAMGFIGSEPNGNDGFGCVNLR